MTLDYTIHSLIAPKETVVKALTEHDKKQGVKVYSAFEALFFLEGVNIAVDQNVGQDVLSHDICFVTVPHSVSDKDVDIFSLFTKSPFHAVDSEGNRFSPPALHAGDHDDQAENIFNALEEEINDDKFNRDYVLINHISNVLEDNSYQGNVVINKNIGVISRMIPEGYTDHTIIHQPPSVSYDQSGIPEKKVVVDNSVFPGAIFSAKIINFDKNPDGNEFELDEGHHGALLYSDSAESLFALESFMPGVVTIISSEIYDAYNVDISVRSWEISDGHADPMSPEYTRSTLEILRDAFEEEVDKFDDAGDDEKASFFEESIEVIEFSLNIATYAYPEHISRREIDLIPSVFGQDEGRVADQIAEILDMDDEDDIDE